MFFKMPVLVYQEKNCVNNHKEDLKELGKKALIVTGRHGAKVCGALLDVQSALESAEIPNILFDEIEENPSVETIMKARETGLRAQVDFVIGIGGGSPMDAAKAIALMLANPGKGEEFLYEKTEGAKAYPVVAIPTTCGTGSEVTGVAVLTRHAICKKASMTHTVFPVLALVDGKYLAAAPKNVLCNTAADALAHLIESYLNTNATDCSRMFVREGMRLWCLSKDILLGERAAKYEDYCNMINASVCAGMAISHTGTSLPHGLSYYVTYELGVPHGKACGYFLAGYLKEAPEKERNYILELSGFSCMHDFENFIKTVCDLTILPQELLKRAAAGIGNDNAKLKNCPFKTDASLLKRIAGVFEV
ncbi:iron-containing alcohol dehydrogenase family protein [Blautia marasmi]|uniref:iron-containing alcohol dehydrogenase family protein n=1 Tax=Blautia marasmi TaxID=1917868 RepID=UPI000CF20B2D|nr:iron-containing alcohol dehydrogenase family protein [Blautia marasmi]